MILFRRRAPRSGETPRRARRRRWRRRLLTVVGLGLLAAVVGPAVFIGVRCTGSGAQSTQGLVTPIPIPTREESLTYLTLPEWSIVYSTEEYARLLGRQAPSRFAYFGSALQYWRYLDGVCKVTRREYPFNTGYQVMLGVIGSSFSVELVLKGLYEHTVGRATEWLATHDTPEDRFAARTAAEYGAFMHTVPWYEFAFGSRLSALWSETPLWGPHLLRKWERRAALSTEYAAKTVYAWVIRTATQSAYAPESLEIQAWLDRVPPSAFGDTRVAPVHKVGEGSFIVKLPRYEAFTAVVLSLASQGVRFINVAGNDEILVTAIAPRDVPSPPPGTSMLVNEPILTEPPKRRLALRVPLTTLTDAIAALRSQGAVVEHIYDY
jgi:hypothetical protein